jgi:hypothetical protein
VQPRAVHRYQAGEAFAVGEVQCQAVGILVDAFDGGVRLDRCAGAHGGVRQRHGVRDGVGD